MPINDDEYEYDNKKKDTIVSAPKSLSQLVGCPKEVANTSCVFHGYLVFLLR